MPGRVGVLVVLFLFCSILRAVEIPECAHLILDRPLEAVIHELNGGNFFEPTPESLLGQYLARTGADSEVVQIRAHGQIGEPILAVAVSEESFPIFFETFADFPNMLEQVHAPNLYEQMVVDLPNTWHFWFRWMHRVYDYVLPDGFRDNGDWRFSAGNIGPMILLSDTETRRFHDYLELTKEPHTDLRYPQRIPGYNYPTGFWTQDWNCTACFFHAPVADWTTNEVMVEGNLDTAPDDPARLPTVGKLKSYRVPSKWVAQAELLQRVWNPNLNGRLMDVLEMPPEEALHAGGSWTAYAITMRTPRERAPFLAVYTHNHRALPAPIQQHWRWGHLPGQARDIGVQGIETVWTIGGDETPGGFTINRWEAGEWRRIPGGALRISAAGDSLPWVVNTTQDIFELQEDETWLQHPGKASDIAVGANGAVWCIGVGANGSGFGIFHWTGETWHEVGGSAVRIAVDGNGNPWVVNQAGSLFRWNGGGWDHVPSPIAVDVAVAPDGTPWILANSINSGGYEIFYFTGDRWVNVPGGGTAIAIGADGGPWHANNAQHIWWGDAVALRPAGPTH